MSLFREEVREHKVERLYGNINLVLPLSWQVISLSLGLMITIAAIFIGIAKYSRTEVADGSILPAGGMLQIFPARTGHVESVFVREGQLVRKGDRLAWVRIEEADRSGVGKQARILSAIEEQRLGLQGQQARIRKAAVAQQQGYAAQAQGLRGEIASIEVQIAAEKRLIAISQTDLARASETAARGFISRRDLASREETLLIRQQRLAGLQQTMLAKASSIEQAESASREAAATAYGATSAIDASRAQVERDRAVIRAEEGYTLLAPVDGRVAALNIFIGEAVTTMNPTMTIVPASERLVARLNIPGKAAGFVRTGQSVRLALDAYPFERFGTVEAVIAIVSTAPLMITDKEGIVSHVYIATASIKNPYVTAYRRRQMLLPGMKFTAHIIVEQRTLFQSLLDPLFAAAQ